MFASPPGYARASQWVLAAITGESAVDDVPGTSGSSLWRGRCGSRRKSTRLGTQATEHAHPDGNARQPTHTPGRAGLRRKGSRVPAVRSGTVLTAYPEKGLI
ncbi:hypothetical protein Acsp01_04420 [Actinoplanes sp. NBRC 101535]|nr:hypothetical protein Acsp01_04420 [Actinoplanes sp. NBRC 101535]